MIDRESIMNGEMKDCDSFLADLEGTLGILFELAHDNDMRGYIYAFWMINYVREKDAKKLLQLLDFASLITFIFLNCFDGMIQMSYVHAKEAILLDNDNKKRKKEFLIQFSDHPDVEHDREFENKVAKEIE